MSDFECKECKKTFGSHESLKQHESMKHAQYSEKRFRIKPMHVYIMIFVIAAAAAGIWVYEGMTSPGKYDDFARCLTSEGFIMAGTDRCSNCLNQKALFGKSFAYVNYKNCDSDNAWCSSNGIDRYPTWILPDGSKTSGTKQLLDLSQASSACVFE